MGTGVEWVPELNGYRSCMGTGVKWAEAVEQPPAAGHHGPCSAFVTACMRACAVCMACVAYMACVACMACVHGMHAYSVHRRTRVAAHVVRECPQVLALHVHECARTSLRACARVCVLVHTVAWCIRWHGAYGAT